MRRNLLILAMLPLLSSLLGCPDRSANSAETTAAPARAMTSALLPPSAQSLQSSAAKPTIKTRTVTAGQGPIAPDDHAERSPLGLSEALSAVLESPTDRDEFALWLPVGYPLAAEAHGYGEVHLELLDPSGRSVASGARSLKHQAQAMGTYTLRASSVSGQGLHYTIVTR